MWASSTAAGRSYSISSSISSSGDPAVRKPTASTVVSTADDDERETEDDITDLLLHDVRRFSEAAATLHLLLQQAELRHKTVSDGCDAGRKVSSVSLASTSSESGGGGDLCVRVHEALTELNRHLKELLSYDCLRVPQVLAPAACLVHSVKELGFDPKGSLSDGQLIDVTPYQLSIAAIQKLESAIADRLKAHLVNDYFSPWDNPPSPYGKFTQSTDDLTCNATSMSSSVYDTTSASRKSSKMSYPNGNRPSIQRRHSAFHSKNNAPDTMSPQQMDQKLFDMGVGVDQAFSRAKAWSNYCKQLLQFVAKRVQLELDQARALQKLAESTRAVIVDDQCLPVHADFLKGLVFECEFAQNCADAMKSLTEYKFIKPLDARRQEHELKRKSLRSTWDRCCKQVTDSEGELRKARQNFSTRDTSYKKARDNSLKMELSNNNKPSISPGGGDAAHPPATMTTDVADLAHQQRARMVEKKRRLEEDAMIKREQALRECRVLENRLEERQSEFDTTKAKIIAELRELIYQCDQTTKAAVVAYFQALSGLWALRPVQYQALSETARTYVPGTEYMKYIQSLPSSPADAAFRGRKWREPDRALSDDDLSLIPRFSSSATGDSAAAKKRIAAGLQHRVSSPRFVGRSPRHNHPVSNHENDDDSSLGSHGDLRIKPPGWTRLKWGGYDTTVGAGGAISDARRSEAAMTHQCQKVRTPAKCAHCDSYTFFQTVQCLECGLAWHKACLNRVEIVCGSSPPNSASSTNSTPLTRTSHVAGGSGPYGRMSIFGVPLENHLTQTNRSVPLVLERCVEELDRRGARIKGIYRTNGVKSKIEQLCECFERQATVDLRDVHPTNIASVVKLYLRQLPDPLLTSGLYDEFVEVAKSFSKDKEAVDAKLTGVDDSSPDDAKKGFEAMAAERLKMLLARIPACNYNTLRFLILHLKRITWFESENQMTSSNVGIVFGPNLLWKDESQATTLLDLAESMLHARIVELLIRFAYDIFNVDPTEERQRYYERMGIPLRRISSVTGDPPDVSAGGGGQKSSALLFPPSTSSTRSNSDNGDLSSPGGSTDDGSAQLMISADGTTSTDTTTTTAAAVTTTAAVNLSRKSATPDLLKTHPLSKQPQTSPSARANFADSSLSEDELPGLLESIDAGDDEDDASAFPDSFPTSTRHSIGGEYRLQRSRPIRQKRSYTTSILVSPQLERKGIVPEPATTGVRPSGGSSRPRSHQTSVATPSTDGTSATADTVTVAPTRGQFVCDSVVHKRTNSDKVVSSATLSARTDERHTTDASVSPSTDDCLETAGLIFSSNPDDTSYV